MTPFDMRRLAVVLALIALLPTACDGDDPARPTETATAVVTTSPATATPPTTPSPTASPQATPTPLPPEPTGLLLVDVESGAAAQLYAGESFPFTRGFEDDGELWIAISSENRSLHFDSGGALIEEVEGYHTGIEPRCQRLESEEPRAVIDDEEYPVTCGVFSPDGRRMLYHIDSEDSEWPQGGYEAWLLDLDSGDMILLSDELRHCGGCDGFAGPAWSTSSRYVIFGETGGDQVFLSDAESGATRRIPADGWGTRMGYQPRWSPAEDAFLAPDAAGNSMLERPDTGAVRPLDLPWPARFDETGTFAYSYAVRGDPFQYGTTIDLANVATGEIVATWPGRPPYVWPDERGVTAVDGEPAALLEGCNNLKDECDPADPCINGTAIYHPALDVPHCLDEMRGAEWSPDRTQVAASRRTDDDDIPYPPPFSEAWDVVLYDLDAATERVLATDIRPPGGEPPQLRWSPDGTRLLVQWPRPSGI